jgi:hypothetical protein
MMDPSISLTVGRKGVRIRSPSFWEPILWIAKDPRLVAPAAFPSGSSLKVISDYFCHQWPTHVEPERRTGLGALTQEEALSGPRGWESGGCRLTRNSPPHCRYCSQSCRVVRKEAVRQ